MADSYVKISDFPMTPTIVDGDYVPIQNGNQNRRFNLANLLVNKDTFTKQEIMELLNNKQPTLVSGGNIKTIGGVSILGPGDIPSGGSSSIPTIQILEDDMFIDIEDQYISIRLTPEQVEYFYNNHFVCAEIGLMKMIFKCEKYGNGDLLVTNPLSYSPDDSDLVQYAGSIYDYEEETYLELDYEYPGSSDYVPYITMQMQDDDWWNDDFAHITIDESIYYKLIDTDILTIHADIYFKDPDGNMEFIFNRPVPYYGGTGGITDTMVSYLPEGRFIQITPYYEYDASTDTDIYYVEMDMMDLYEDLDDVPFIYIPDNYIDFDPESMWCSLQLQFSEDEDYFYDKSFVQVSVGTYGYSIFKIDRNNGYDPIISGSITLDDAYDFIGYIEERDNNYYIELDLQYKLEYPLEDGTYELQVENGKPTWVLKE